MSDVGKAIKSNRNSATAHNDAGGLKLQDKAKKDNFEDCKMCCCRFELSLKAGSPLQTRHGPDVTRRRNTLQRVARLSLRSWTC
ncbi:unnamed protein product [Effrenium voratum]|nr:unnamed protein product [Effrenium voratum]